MIGSQSIVLAFVCVASLATPCLAQTVLRVRPGAQPGGDGTTWESAFSNLQDALAAGRSVSSTTGVQIWLAAGTYRPVTIAGGCASVTIEDRSASFELFSRLTILGGFPSTGNPGLSERNFVQFETILSGDLCGNDPVDPLVIANRTDNSLHVVSVDFATQAVIDGVTIRGGNADAPGATKGGAISALGSSLTLRNCQIVGNRSTGSGGAIAAAPDFKAPHTLTINNSTLRGNVAGDLGGAVFVEGDGTLTLRFSTFIANRAVSGGAVASQASRVRVGSTSFLGNRAYPASGLPANISSANTGGGIRVDNAELLMMNAIFSGNIAGWSGGAAVFNAPNDLLSVYHSTVANNRAENSLVGGIAINPPFFSLQSRVYHTIFWGNRDSRTANKPIPYLVLRDLAIADRPWVEYAQLGRVDGGSVVTPSAFDLRRIYMDGQFFWTGGGLSGPTTPAAPEAPASGAIFANAIGNNVAAGTELDDLRLIRNNAAVIDIGDNRIIAPDLLDLDNDNDRAEALPVDISGAPRRQNDPQTNDTGLSPPFAPFVDIGAHENTVEPFTSWKGVGDIADGSFTNSTGWTAGVPSISTSALFDVIVPTPTNPNPPVAYQVALSTPLQARRLLFQSPREVTLLFQADPNQDLTLSSNDSLLEPSLVIGTNPGLNATMVLRRQFPQPPFEIGDRNGILASIVSLGNAVGTRGTARLVSPGSALSFSSLLVGNAGIGNVQALAGTTLSGPSVSLGVAPNASGGISLSGAGATLAFGNSTTGSLTVGQSGAGSLVLTAGAAVTRSSVMSTLILAQNAGSTALLSASGSGTIADLRANTTRIADAGIASISVDDNAQLLTGGSGRTVVAGSLGSQASIFLGTQSVWEDRSPGLLIGQNGPANISMIRSSAIIANGMELRPGSKITGEGEIQVGDGTFISVGDIEPGTNAPSRSATPGTITIRGRYEQIVAVPGGQSSSGQIILDVADPANSQGYDRLNIIGPALLGGGLNVRLAAGAVIPANAELELISALSLSESPSTPPTRFDVAFLPPVLDTQGLPTNRFLNMRYEGGPGRSATVRLVQDSLGNPIDLADPDAFDPAGEPTSVTAGDITGPLGTPDGKPDLVLSVPNATNPLTSNGSIVVLVNAGTDGSGNWLGFNRSIVIPAQREPVAVEIAHMDDDPRPDLVFVNRSSGTVQVARNGEGDAFSINSTLSAPGEPVALAVTDLGASGRPEIAVARFAQNDVRIFTSTTEPYVFAPDTIDYAVPTGPVSIAAFNPDQDKDLQQQKRNLAVASATSSAVSLFLNDSNELFVDLNVLPPIAVGQTPARVFTANLGRNDLGQNINAVVTLNRGDDTISILSKTAAGLNYNPAVNIPAGFDARGLAISDLDLDGDKDLAVISRGADDAEDPLRINVIRNDLQAGGTRNQQLALVPAESLDGGPNPRFVVNANFTDDIGGKQDLITISEPGGTPLGDRGPTTLGRLLRNRAVAGPSACSPADIGNTDGDPGSDGVLDNGDFNLFFAAFFADTSNPVRLNADIANTDGDPGSDGQVDNGDFNVFFNFFFLGC